MTKILIIGGGGMVGQKLAHHLIATEPATDITLFDLRFPPDQSTKFNLMVGNLTDSKWIQKIAKARYDIIFHLAAIVSGDAEQNFNKGWDINMMSMWHLLQSLRSEHEASQGAYRAKIVFTSSIAVFGAPFPETIDDTFLSAPLTSYGAQKATSELMLSDFSRKGFVDGIALRLPTICVRPGKPNLAASSFFSGIIREPLNGIEAVLPVSDTVRHWHASPKSAVGFLKHAAALDTELLDGRRALNLPGVSCTVAEQIEALRSSAGQSAVDLIRYEPDSTIEKIVAGWPQNFDPQRAVSLGFQADENFSEIIETYIAEDMNPS